MPTTPTHLEGEAVLLRIHIGELDRVGHRPLYDVILADARRMELAGATVTRGIASFGARSLIHTAKVLRLSEDLPLVVEIVDTQEKINAFVTHLDTLFEQAHCGGLVTQEKVKIIKYHS